MWRQIEKSFQTKIPGARSSGDKNEDESATLDRLSLRFRQVMPKAGLGRCVDIIEFFLIDDKFDGAKR